MAVIKTFAIAILGLGVIGAALDGALARSGARVVGFDRVHSPHDHGSSHDKIRLVHVVCCSIRQ